MLICGIWEYQAVTYIPVAALHFPGTCRPYPWAERKPVLLSGGISNGSGPGYGRIVAGKSCRGAGLSPGSVVSIIPVGKPGWSLQGGRATVRSHVG